MLNLRNYINDIISKDEISGVVVTHGTDSLEETAYFLDLTLDTPKPVIVTGAMRSSDELGYDGPSNLAAAVCTAISDEAYNKGVLVVLSNEVLLASEATKTNTLTLNTFKSLTCGPLGIIDCDKLVLSRDIVDRQTILVDKVEPDVALIKSGVGMDDSF